MANLNAIFNKIAKEINSNTGFDTSEQTFYFGDDQVGFSIDHDHSDLSRSERLAVMKETYTDSTEFSGYDLGDEVIYDNAIYDSRL